MVIGYTCVSGGGIELDDADAFATVASRVLGNEKYDELVKQTITLPKGMANDKIVDEVVRILNRPIVKFALRLVK